MDDLLPALVRQRYPGETTFFVISVLAFSLLAASAILQLVETVLFRRWQKPPLLMQAISLVATVAAAIMIVVATVLQECVNDIFDSITSKDLTCSDARQSSIIVITTFAVQACVITLLDIFERRGYKLWTWPRSLFVLSTTLFAMFVAYQGSGSDFWLSYGPAGFLLPVRVVAALPLFVLAFYTYVAGIGRIVSRNKFALQIGYWFYVFVPLIYVLPQTDDRRRFAQILSSWFLFARTLASLVFVVDCGKEDRLRTLPEFFFVTFERYY